MNKFKVKSGIYCIKNLINGKVYVGGTIRLGHSFSDRKWKLNNNENKPNKGLQYDWNKHGESSFEFIVLEYVKDLNRLDDVETLWIEELDATNKNYGYNVYPEGGNCKGRKRDNPVSKETREKMSKSFKGRIPWNKGRPRSEKTKKKISETLTGNKLSEEHKKKIGEASKGENNPSAKLNEWQVRVIKRCLELGIKQLDLAKIFNVTDTTIANINTGRTWGHIKQIKIEVL